MTGRNKIPAKGAQRRYLDSVMGTLREGVGRTAGRGGEEAAETARLLSFAELWAGPFCV